MLDPPPPVVNDMSLRDRSSIMTLGVCKLEGGVITLLLMYIYIQRTSLADRACQAGRVGQAMGTLPAWPAELPAQSALPAKDVPWIELVRGGHFWSLKQYVISGIPKQTQAPGYLCS